MFCPHPPFVFGENGEDVSAQYRKYVAYSGEKDPRSISRSRQFLRRLSWPVRLHHAAHPGSDRSPARRFGYAADHHSRNPTTARSSTSIRTTFDNTDLKERMAILNAYYFPGRRYDALYQQVTPVNSFRIVLNTYFGAHLDPLTDRSFFSTWDEPYVFQDVTEAVRETEN